MRQEHAAAHPSTISGVEKPCRLLSNQWRALCRLLSNQRKAETGDGTLNPVLRMAAGAVAGIVAMSSTYHLDMVRGRLTVQEGFHKQQYSGIMHAYQEIIRKVSSCFRSLLPPRAAPRWQRCSV
jgi:hypothetical protein